MIPSFSRAVRLALILAVLPAAMFHARAHEDKTKAASDDAAGEDALVEATPNQIKIINKSHRKWTLTVSSMTMGEHKFKQIKIDKTLTLATLKPRKPVSGKFELLKGKTFDFVASEVGKKNGMVHLTIEDAERNRASFCLLSKAGVMKLYLEKAEFMDEMDPHGMLETNKPASGSLTILDQPDEP